MSNQTKFIYFCGASDQIQCLDMIGKCSTTKLYPQDYFLFKKQETMEEQSAYNKLATNYSAIWTVKTPPNPQINKTAKATVDQDSEVCLNFLYY